MRYVNAFLGTLMLAFAAVQYNDPDAPLWITIYLVPAAWGFAAALRRKQLRAPVLTALLWLSVALGGAGVAYYWPQTPEFWRKDVWWNDEEAREGMGMMIAFAVLLVALATRLTARTDRS